MEEESFRKLKIIFAFLSLGTLWLSYFLRITNPFILSQIPVSMTEVILIGLSCIIPLMNLCLLLSFSFENSMERRFFFIFSFLLVFTIIISPGLATGGLFNNDSFSHLYIVRNLLSKDFDLGLYYGDYGNYGGFFFHMLIVITTIITNIDPHFLILFFPQLVMFSFFFIGIYLLVFKCLEEESPDRKQYIFLLVIFFPRHIFYNAAFHPYYFLLSLMPLALYLTLNLTKMNIVPLIIINFIAIQSHIYGLFFLAFCIGIIIIVFIIKKVGEVQYKFILVLIWSVYGIGFLIILLPNLVENIITVLPIHTLIKEGIITQFQSGGALFQTSGAAPPIQSVLDLAGRNTLVILKILLDWTEFYLPIFMVLICNLFYYSISQKTGIKFQGSKQAQIKLLCDLFFVVFLVVLFYGANLLLERALVLMTFIYVIICIHYLFTISTIIIVRTKKFNSNGSKIYQFFSKYKYRAFRITFLLVLLGFSLFAFINYRYNTIIYRYEAVNWINDNTPENTTFLASLSRLDLVIKGMTSQNATTYCGSLFNSSIDETKRVTSYLRYWKFINTSLYIIIDIIDDRKLERVWGGYPSVGKAPTYVNYDNAIEMVKDSIHYNLVYNNKEIFIYEITL